MHRGALLLTYTVMLSAALGAQRARPTRSVPPPVMFPFPALMQPVGGGLQPASPFVPPAQSGAARDLFLVGSGRQAPLPPQVPFGLGYNTGLAYSAPSPGQPTATPARPISGFLRLSVTPLAAQVFVDGYFVGNVSDVEAQGVLTLAAGPHRIELRAPGYDPSTVNVQIAPLETITFRAALELVSPPASTVHLATTREPMYLIPRCYLGNVPPRADRLPPGCRVADAQVLSGR